MAAKCEKCGDSCAIHTTSQGKNVGRKYYTCQQRCNFFMWLDQYKLCRCGGGQCKVRTAKTLTNKGRPLWCCPESTGPDNRGCGMFEWIEEREETVSNQEIGQSSQGSMINMPTEEISQQSQCTTSNMATPSPPSSEYLKGYLRGVIRGYGRRIGTYEELLDALEKLDLKKD